MPDYPGQQHYPASSEIDAWAGELWKLADATACEGGTLTDAVNRFPFGVRHQKGTAYIKFVPDGPEPLEPFHGLWQPAPSGPAPLLVHVPGYGAEMSAHPELVSQGFNVLHVNPLGYATPQGPDESKKRDGSWPVLPDTIRSLGRAGYRHWLTDVLLAARWAQAQPSVLPDRVSFFGTSQGGGTALLLGSLFNDRGARCVAADVPFLTHFPMVYAEREKGAYALAEKALAEAGSEAAAWRAVGAIDTMNHVHRLNLPVLLTAGEKDGVCTPKSIEALFHKLPGTRSYTLIQNQAHDYTRTFLYLAAAWFRLWA
ncbi:MAG: acetylxylan esterase [Planctomycetota bacterium]|nr:acetylxylan esterase [Planctomycetota bacterium]